MNDWHLLQLERGEITVPFTVRFATYATHAASHARALGSVPSSFTVWEYGGGGGHVSAGFGGMFTFPRYSVTNGSDMWEYGGGGGHISAGFGGMFTFPRRYPGVLVN